MTDVPFYRAEPDAEFADRLERELLRRLTDPAVVTLTEVALVTDVHEPDDDVTTPDLQDADRRLWPPRMRLVAGGLVAAGLLAVLALVVRNSPESEPAVAPPAANGLIAFAGNPGDGSAQSDIYVVAPDGTGLRALTSTPELAEYAPSWSPDGSLLAFVRTDPPSIPHLRDCTPHCEFVVVDPTTGVETFSADVDDAGGGAWVPTGVAWSPDGRAIVVQSLACGVGGCTGGGSVIADLETGAFTTLSGYEVMWSPDGEWLSLVKGTENVPGPSLLLVPADLIGTGDVVDIAELAGVRPVPGAGAVEWMPDGAAMLVSELAPDSELIEHVGEAEAWIDVVTVSDGRRRRLIEDGFDPVVSPDGSQIAYSHERAPAGITDIWVANADGSDPRRVTFSSTPPVWSPDGSLLLASDADGWITVQPDGTARTQVTPFMHPDANAGCCPDYRPSWQPAAAQDDRRVGFVGLPPEGATPSTPERGELVVYVAGPELGSRTWVYADGRLIWHRYGNLPEGVNTEFTGFLEQRLTPEGVELLRSETVSLVAELLDDGRVGVLDSAGLPSDRVQVCSWNLCEILVRNNGRLDRFPWSPGDASRLVARITDPAAWLPASAWEDREIKAYIPSSYRVEFMPADALDLLPEAARELLADPILTTDEARGLHEVLAEAGIERDSQNDGHRGGLNPWSLTYRIDPGGDAPVGDSRHIVVEPYLPHGQAYCQHCG